MSDKQLLIRVDDAGLNDETNRGVEAALRAGVARSVGIMACTPRFAAAADMLKSLPGTFSVGVHLTLNAEWGRYRWGPVLPAAEVPSLVDEDGAFPRNHQLYIARPPKIEHVLAELRAQIARVRDAGLVPCYADEHMVFSESSPWMLDPIAEIVAEAGLLYDRKLGLPRPPKGIVTAEGLAEALRLSDHRRMLLITHPAASGPQMTSLLDDPEANARIAANRAAELAMLSDPELAGFLADAGVTPIGYSDLR